MHVHVLFFGSGWIRLTICTCYESRLTIFLVGQSLGLDLTSHTAFITYLVDGMEDSGMGSHTGRTCLWDKNMDMYMFACIEYRNDCVTHGKGVCGCIPITV